MLNGENKEMCYQLLQRYGSKAQMLMAIEECSELQKAICKNFRKNAKCLTTDVDESILEELVDVIVMCEQLRLMACVDMGEINAMAKIKLERALKR